MEAPSLSSLTDCNHHLENRCINITQITPKVLQLASLTIGEGYVSLLDYRRRLC